MKGLPVNRGRLCRGILLMVIGVFLLAPVVDRIVAVVGDEIITERELNEAYNRDALDLMSGDTLMASSQQKLDKSEYLDRMIENKLIQKEIKRQGIDIEDMDVDRALERKRKALGLSEEEFRNALAGQGIDMEQYRNAIREQLTTYRLISQEVRGEIEITEREIEAYYNQRPQQFMGEDTYHIYFIFLRFPSSEREKGKQEALSEMERIRSKIDSLEDFQEMARQYSHASSASRGGNIGYFKIDEMLPLFKKNVKDLKSDEMSSLFYDDSGVYLIYLADIKKGEQKPLEEVRERISSILYQQESMERYDIWLKRLKARTYTENRLKKEEPSP